MLRFRSNQINPKPGALRRVSFCRVARCASVDVTVRTRGTSARYFPAGCSHLQSIKINKPQIHRDLRLIVWFAVRDLKTQCRHARFVHSPWPCAATERTFIRTRVNAATRCGTDLHGIDPCADKNDRFAARLPGGSHRMRGTMRAGTLLIAGYDPEETTGPCCADACRMRLLFRGARDV